MGAWSHEPFGNDTACDWSYGLLEGNDLTPVRTAIRAALDAEEYLDADVASEAVAAVEVLAKILGRGTQADAYTEEVDAWVARLSEPADPALLDDARRVIDRVLSDPSELRELWDESEDAQVWRESLDRLREGLHA